MRVNAKTTIYTFLVINNELEGGRRNRKATARLLILRLTFYAASTFAELFSSECSLGIAGPVTLVVC